MKFMSKIFDKRECEYADNEIIALADAEMIPAAEVNDEMFAQEMLGQTVAFRLQDKAVVAPCNGVLEVMFPTGHAFAIRMHNGMGILVHVGIDTVNLKGKGFKVLAKQGQQIKAGQKILEINQEIIKQHGYDPTTMLIVTEPLDENEKIKFIEYGAVKRGQVINL